ncbi:unnamed protein product [Mytilus edulis]|uniref:Uncharacterized protein n=1 Tax=Mytilus edulis TaxID=6550 RepID=A0A8S3Q196_MYTED|nr:unnamed protein product [Mytilus edulis]
MHITEQGGDVYYTGTSAQLIDSSMSLVKVATKDAKKLQSILEREYFSNWREKCDIREFYGYRVNQTDSLLRKISGGFRINEVDIYNKLRGIQFSDAVDVKIVKFSFGDELDSGVVHLGMVAISRCNDTLDAVSCLYTLNFTIAPTLVTKTEESTFIGIPYCTDTTSWYEKKGSWIYHSESTWQFLHSESVTRIQKTKHCFSYQ